MHLAKRPDGVSADGQDATNAAIDELVAIVRLLTETTLIDAMAATVLDPNRQSKFDREIAKAGAELAKGDAELAKNKPKSDKAMNHFKKAWEHAIHAAREAARPPEPEREEDDDRTDPLDIAGLLPGDAIESLIQYIEDQGPSMPQGSSLITDLNAVIAALGDDQAAIDLLKDFRKRVNEDKADHLLTNEQARILRQSARIIIRAIEAG